MCTEVTGMDNTQHQQFAGKQQQTMDNSQSQTRGGGDVKTMPASKWHTI